MRILFTIVACVASMSASASPSQATPTPTVVSNTKPRLDAAGAIIDIHDGNTLLVNGTYYWYGASYGGCEEQVTGCHSGAVGECGFQLNHTVSLATSKDLVTWDVHGVVLPTGNRPPGVLFSPWVAVSPVDGTFVLWTNVLPVVGGHADFEASVYTVATSRTPFGPFTTVNANVTGLHYQELPDAPSIFVDDDGTGYVAYTHERTHINTIEVLEPDLTRPATGAAANSSAVIGDPNNEGIAMFKRDGLYYVVFGTCCCFCAAGTGVKVYTATEPLGPYTFRGQIAAFPNGTSIWQAQTGSVFFTGADWVLAGDRWQSAPDHVKAHDFTYVTPLAFNPDGSINRITWQDSVTIQLG